jgi:predicted transcriptional regulator
MRMQLSEIQEILKADVIFGDDRLDIEVTGGAASDLMSDLLRGPTKTGVLVLSGLNNIQVIRTAVIAGVTAVVFVRDKEPSADMIAHAREHELPLLSTPFTMYTACGRLFGRGLRGIEQKLPT